MNPTWQQILVQFDDYQRHAEHTAAMHLGPELNKAEDAGLLASWWFTRKAPHWRLRYLPSQKQTQHDARAYVQQSMDTLRGKGHLAEWVETIYEPETHVFGGPEGMNVAHEMFHQDSRHILDYLNSYHTINSDTADSADEGTDKRRELSVLLTATMMRGARQDFYEQADIWARLAENRPLSPQPSRGHLPAMASSLRRLITVDAGPTSPLLAPGGSLHHIANWAVAFHSAGAALSDLAQNGTLRRGLRGVLAHHVIFHWNRIGLSYHTQATLAYTAKTLILGD